MAMITIVCPKCGGVAKLSLVDATYVGPRRCWKCHEYFTISIENNRITSCEPLSEEEFERQQEEKKAAEKAGGGISFSSRKEPEVPQAPPEKQLNFIDSLSPKEPSIQFEPVKPAALFPPEKVQTFTSEPNVNKEHDKPPKAKTPPEKPRDYTKPSSQKKSSYQPQPLEPGAVFPPERVQTFVPMEDKQEEPEKPTKPKKPQDKFNIFIPPAG